MSMINIIIPSAAAVTMMMRRDLMIAIGSYYRVKSLHYLIFDPSANVHEYNSYLFEIVFNPINP